MPQTPDVCAWGMPNTCWQGMPAMTCATSALPTGVTPTPPTRPLPICCGPKCLSISLAIRAELPSVSCQGVFPGIFLLGGELNPAVLQLLYHGHLKAC